MDFSSKYTYIEKNQVNLHEEDEPSANSFQIDFLKLSDGYNNLSLGDPIKCGKCQVYLSCHSKITAKVESKDLAKNKKKPESSKPLPKYDVFQSIKEEDIEQTIVLKMKKEDEEVKADELESSHQKAQLLKDQPPNQEEKALPNVEKIDSSEIFFSGDIKELEQEKELPKKSKLANPSESEKSEKSERNEISEESAKQLEKANLEQQKDINLESKKEGDIKLASAVEKECDAPEEFLKKPEGPAGMFWPCEFCGFINPVQLEKEEHPTKKDTFYLIESAFKKEIKEVVEDVSVVFCIDCSGSMSSSVEIGNGGGVRSLESNFTQEEIEMLKAVFENPEELKNQMNARFNPFLAKNNKTFISRKNCILEAIQSQLEGLKRSFPNQMVGIVCFNDDIIVIGDGFGDQVVIAGDHLNNMEYCFDKGRSSKNDLLKHKISESMERILQKFKSIQEKGQTALAPAIAVSIGLASQGKLGSRVIVCTDGLANRGFGNLEVVGSEQAAREYEALGELARDSGISVSLITLKGEECNTLCISKTVEISGGDINRVNPDEISKEFQELLNKRVIGGEVFLRVVLHKGMKIITKETENLKDLGTVFEKRLGTITADFGIALEYKQKNKNELKDFEIELTDLDHLPFQAQIFFKTTQGDRMLRVITMLQPLTTSIHQAYANADLDVLNNTLNYQSRQAFLREGFKGSLDYADRYQRLYENIRRSDQNRFDTNDMDESLNDVTIKKQKQIKMIKKVEESSKQSLNKAEIEELEEDVTHTMKKGFYRRK